MATTNKILQTGPRGGVYYLSPRGRKVYVSRRNMNRFSPMPQSPVMTPENLPIISAAPNVGNLPITVLYPQSVSLATLSPLSPTLNGRSNLSPRPTLNGRNRYNNLTPQQEKYCSCLKQVEAKGTAYNPYKICAASTGTTLGRGHHCPK